MNRTLKLFASRSFTILLFHLGLLFFLWPILSIPASENGLTIFGYIFIVWTILVFALFLVGTSLRITRQKNENSNDV